MHSVGIGTPFYMAPEQSHGNTGDYNHLADIFSLGLIFFEMWVGADFNTSCELIKTFQLLKEHNIIEKEYLDKIPPDAAKLILWLVQSDPTMRPSTTALLQR